jgi:hypothetical protein
MTLSAHTRHCGGGLFLGVTCPCVFYAVRYSHWYVREVQYCCEPLNWKEFFCS